ncbi:hypothetical protein B0T17DRAFT_475005, partial [Bombardia bombarda]
GGGKVELSREFLEEYTGGTLVGISIGFAVLTTVVLGLRFWARKFQGAEIGLHDALIVGAFVANLGLCFLGIVMVEIGGVGYHVVALERQNPEILVTWAKVLLAFEIVYFTAVTLPKLSILCLYIRVFNWTPRAGMRNVALLLAGIVIAMWLSLTVTACFQCRPIAYWWDKSIPNGSCINVQTFYHAQSIPGFILDLFIMALPLKTIWCLKMPKAKRVALLLVFLVASLGVVASIVRAITFFSNSAFNDRTWAGVPLTGWSIVEASCYIIANCLPHLRPLIIHFSPQWLKDTTQRLLDKASRFV